MTTDALRRLAALLTITSAASLAHAAGAEAGYYTVLSCKDRNGTTAPARQGSAMGWQQVADPVGANALSFSDTCAGGEGLTAQISTGTPLPSQSKAGWTFKAPPATSLEAWHLDWQSITVPGAAGRTSIAEIVDDLGQTHATKQGAGTVDPFLQFGHSTGAQALTVQGRCSNGSYNCADGFSTRVHLNRSEIRLIDDHAPAGTVSGDAVERSEWAGPQAVSVAATDQGGGVHRLITRVGSQDVDARTIDANGGECALLTGQGGDRPVRLPRPCKTEPGSTELTIDPAQAPDGPATVRIDVDDIAGNRTTVYGPVTKVVDVRPPVVAEPVVAGEAREGATLQCGASADGQGVALGYAWLRTNPDGTGAAVIPGATGATYAPTAQDVGRKVVCRVAATDDGGTATRDSSITSGAFAGGALVADFCAGRPTGPKDECGDLDGDGVVNRLDPDRDGDGTPGGQDVDDLDPTKTTAPTGTAADHGGKGGNGPTGGTLQLGPPGTPNGTNATALATLLARDERTGSSTIRVAHGRKVTITGRLTTPGGAPIAGAKLEVSTQLRRSGAPLAGAGLVATDQKGQYRFVLPAGASRVVRFGYRARFGDTELARTAQVTVLVKAKVTFKLARRSLRNGQTLKYVGKVAGPQTGGRFAEVLVRAGRRWIVVCSVRTDARGAFACAHRFTKTKRTTRYVFRARVRRQAGLPYEPATSSTRSIVVRP